MFSLGCSVISSNRSVSVRLALKCVGKDHSIVCFPPPGNGEWMTLLFYQSDGQGVVVWGRTRVFSSVCCKLGGIVL